MFPPPWPKAVHFFAIAIPTFILLPTLEYVLVANKPPIASDKYEVLEVKQWAGQRWYLLDYIDIGERLQTGEWVVLMYHNDCPDCRLAIPEYEKMYNDLKGNDINMAFIEMPPYGDENQQLVGDNSKADRGSLSQSKKWFVQTPVIVVLNNGVVLKAWQGTAPSFDELINAAFGQ